MCAAQTLEVCYVIDNNVTCRVVILEKADVYLLCLSVLAVIEWCSYTGYTHAQLSTNTQPK